MNNNYPINFKIQLTSKDLLHFNIDFMTKGYKKFLYAFSYLVIVPSGIYNIVGDGDTNYLIIGFMCMFIILPFALVWNVKRNYKLHKNLHEPIEYTIDRNTINLLGQTFSSTVSISTLYKIAENKSGFYLWHSNRAANIIPKHLLNMDNIAALSRWKDEMKVMYKIK